MYTEAKDRVKREKDADKGNEVFRAVGCAFLATIGKEGRKEGRKVR